MAEGSGDDEAEGPGEDGDGDAGGRGEFFSVDLRRGQRPAPGHLEAGDNLEVTGTLSSSEPSLRSSRDRRE